MKSLFLKIFLSFWAAQALFLVLAILVTIALRPARHGIESQGPQILAEVVNAYQGGGERAAHDYLEEVLHTQHVRAFVFDPSGHELAGRQVPPWIEDVRQGVPPHGGALHGGFPHHRGWIDSLLPDRILRQALTLDGKRYTLVLELPPGPRIFFGPHEGLVDSQSRLLKDVSHELRSPLARLSVALGLARQRGTPEIEASLNRIELEADRLNQLIQRLLTISRLESGTDGLRKATVSLRELVEQVAHDAEYENPGRGCRVTSRADMPADAADEFLVEADSNLLRSAFENVIRNATRYTAEGTTVEVRLERLQAANGQEIVVRVLDSGPGVPDEALQKIFEPFYRLDDARNRQTGGAGLGLSIADRAIRLHGGQLRASNRKEGGLEVEIRIPAAAGFALPAHS